MRHATRPEVAVRSTRPSAELRRAVYRRRRRTALSAGLALLALVIALWSPILHASSGAQSRSGSARATPKTLQITDGGRTLSLQAPARATANRRRALVQLLDERLPARRVVASGAARITLELDASATAGAIEAGGGSASVVRRPVKSLIMAPVIAQQLRNNCEAAALSILLATTGVRVSQLQLQSAMARSGPLDPGERAGKEIWGDPDRGFVGRADGGGAAGGFGVYPGPVAALAARNGRSLQNITGSSAKTVYSRVLSGHAVMVWVALSTGPFGTWVSPQGKSIRVNYGEHTVTLVGISGDQLRVDDPLTGRLEYWSRSTFETMWRALGRRALAA